MKKLSITALRRSKSKEGRRASKIFRHIGKRR
jgi:hypothetical protein